MGALSFLLGCTPVAHRYADVQLDVPGEMPPEAEFVRICVEGVGTQEFGARLTGRFSMTGLPAGEPANVGVDVLDADGGLLMSASVDGLLDHTLATRLECSSGAVCAPCEGESTVPLLEDAWLLGVRFLEAG